MCAGRAPIGYIGISEFPSRGLLERSILHATQHPTLTSDSGGSEEAAPRDSLQHRHAKADNALPGKRETPTSEHGALGEQQWILQHNHA